MFDQRERRKVISKRGWWDAQTLANSSEAFCATRALHTKRGRLKMTDALDFAIIKFLSQDSRQHCALRPNRRLPVRGSLAPSCTRNVSQSRGVLTKHQPHLPFNSATIATSLCFGGILVNKHQVQSTNHSIHPPKAPPPKSPPM